MHSINHYFNMHHTPSFAIAPVASSSTLVKIALLVCNPSNLASKFCSLPRIDNCSFSLEYSGFLPLPESTPDSKFRDSLVGNSFVVLLDTSFKEEDHSSSGSLRLTWPNIESSLLQNCHLWGYAVQWISLVREKKN